MRVFGSTTRVTWVSSNNANIAAEHQEPAEVLSQLGDTSNPPVYGEYKCCQRGSLWCPCGGLWCHMLQFSIFIGNRRKQKTTDIWRCANKEQCVPDKTGCSCRTTTQGVRLARQGCWCCACRSRSPVLHQSYCRIPSMSPYTSVSPLEVTNQCPHEHFYHH